MGLSDYKLTDGAIAQKGVVAAADRLTGTAAQNKAVFDRLIRESVQGLFNGLIDAMSGSGGAGEIGAAAIDGVTGSDVQTALRSLKTLLDTKEAASDAAAALALKSDKAVTDLHIKSISLNAETGVFTFTREDGSFFTIDTVLEKVATNWAFDQETQSLILTLADGTAQHVPLSAFITETEFDDSAQLTFSVENHRVTATVKEGSITDTMLSSALIAQMRSYVAASAGSAADAAQSAAAAEGYRDAASRSAAAAQSAESEARSSEASAKAAERGAQTYAGAAASSASAAANSAGESADSASLAESYAHGGTGTREGEDADNAEYYMNRAREIVGGDYATETELAAVKSALEGQIASAASAAACAASAAQETAERALELAGEAGGEAVGAHNTAEDAHPALHIAISSLESRLATLELKYLYDVTGNSFEVSFADLTGLEVSGVWNKELARIEF